MKGPFSLEIKSDNLPKPEMIKTAITEGEHDDIEEMPMEELSVATPRFNVQDDQSSLKMSVSDED